jgi:GNAT superfamily N-acetyltransferase
VTRASSPAPVAYDLRPVSIHDAEGYVRCHVECLAETYAPIMPPAFAEQHRAAIGDRIRQTREQWAAWELEPAERRTRCWLASDVTGETVGIARSGPGPQQWENDLGAPVPAVDLELHHIYTLNRTHGTGLGQALLELAIGPADAYLWILHGNPRAERFYRRNGFVPDGVELSCGPTWFHRTMFRMVRR